MRSVASPRRQSKRAPGCGRRSRLRILHLFHGRKPTTETTMSDEASGRASDGNTAANEQPYDWDKCAVRLSITFLPGDGDEGGRQIIIGCNTHSDPPLIETARKAGLGSLPPMIVPEGTRSISRQSRRPARQKYLSVTRPVPEQAARRTCS